MAMSRSAEARKHADRVRATLPGDRKLMIGVDRLDYTKGLPDRLRAFRRLLELHPEYCKRATLMQIPPGAQLNAPLQVDPIGVEPDVVQSRLAPLR